MPVTVYSNEGGAAIIIEHMIDAKDAVASGKYSFNPPASAKKSAPAPIEIPKPVVKPASVKEVKVEPVVENDVVEDSPKEEEPPIRKINPRLIRK